MWSVLIFLAIVKINIIIGNDRKWSPDGVKDLMCPESCYNEYEQYCCACYAQPVWEIPSFNINIYHLFIEILDVEFKRTQLFSTPDYFGNSSVFYFKFVNRKLRKLPDNACDFDLVNINVSFNAFTEIGNLSCLFKLDTLILRGNLISKVSNETFKGLDNLRVVDLSYNRIQYMEPNAILNNGVLKFNFDSNSFKELDVSNIVAPNKTMCSVSFRNNIHQLEITNSMNYQIEQNSSKICLDVDFSGVSTSQHVLVTISKHIDSIEIPKYVPCGNLVYKGSKFNCDCELAELFPISFDDIKRLYEKDASEYYCETPENIRNKTLKDVYDNKTLHDEMICVIKDNCSSTISCACTCISQPSQKRLLIDCSNQSCTDFPKYVPDSKYDITLNMRHNNIQNVCAKDYFKRIKILDLFENPVNVINDNIEMLVEASEIILYNHSLQTLPKSVQNLHPDIFRFGTNGIPCNCKNAWIGEWRRFIKASNDFPLYCSNYNKTLIEDIDLADCDKTVTQPYWIISFATVFVTVTLIVLVIYKYFRFDILIMKRKLLSAKRRINSWEYDVFISCDDENTEVRFFILQILEPFLSDNDITTYIPFRDELIGMPHEENLIENLKKCKYALIIQSEDMYNTTESRSRCFRRLEYTIAWQYFIKRFLEKILVIKFDGTDFDDFQLANTRALNRIGMGFIITNRQKSLKDKLLETFNEPLIAINMFFRHRQRMRQNVSISIETNHI